jgi:hypothetical protein
LGRSLRCVVAATLLSDGFKWRSAFCAVAFRSVGHDWARSGVPRTDERRASWATRDHWSSRQMTRRSASATSWPSTTSPSGCRATVFSVCSARTARARRPPSACCSIWCGPRAGRSASSGHRNPAFASRTCGGSAPASRRWRPMPTSRDGRTCAAFVVLLLCTLPFGGGGLVLFSRRDVTGPTSG